MSDWTHAICGTCWATKEPDRRPVRLAGADPETCCYCGKETTDGIFVRDEPGAPGHCDHDSDPPGPPVLLFGKRPGESWEEHNERLIEHLNAKTGMSWAVKKPPDK